MLAKIPLWVFFVLALLLYLGFRPSRTRQVAPVTMVMVAAAMFGISLFGVTTAFGARPYALIAWTTGLVAALALGPRVFGPRGMALVPESSSVEVAGSWLPLALMMGIFVAKFAQGFTTGLGSPIVSQPWFVATESLFLGLLSGGFVVRAIALGRFARTAARA